MASKHELVLNAVQALIATALPLARVTRNRPDPSAPFAGGEVVIQDGDPGEPDITLSPLTYHYSRRIILRVWPPKGEGTREERLDAMLTPIGAACAADRTLGGLTEWLEPSAADTNDLTIFGAADPLVAEADLTAVYSSPSPL